MEEDKVHGKVELPDRSYSGVVKRTIREFASQIGFKPSAMGEIELIISELISNAVKYAHEKCYFLYRMIVDKQSKGIEIIYIDSGPGMREPTRMIRDGVTTSTTSRGEGLGAVFRMSDYFDMFSQYNLGTYILSRKYVRPKDKRTVRPSTLGLVCVAAPGETLCGDNWQVIYAQNREQMKILLADGLGHGENAHLASVKAVESFEQHCRLPLEDKLRSMHQDLKKTRGAVCMVCTVDPKANTILFCGVGNISAKVISPNNVSNCVSYNGIVGYTMPATINEREVQWEGNNLFVGHSDGINTRWSMEDYPGLKNHDPALIAAVLYHNHNRGHDDVLVLVLKYQKKQFYPFSFMLEDEE